MKKISIFLLFLAIASGCTAQPDKVEEKEYDNCLKMEDKAEKNICLLDYAGYMVYYDMHELDLEVCEKIDSNQIFQQDCYWMVAMKTKNQEICDLIFESDEEDPAQDNCKNEINYEFEGAKWELEQGFPPYADPLALIYSGKAELTGWIIYASFYGGEPETRFHVSDEDLKKLPPTMQGHSNYALETSEEMISQLEKYTEQNPATLVVDKVGAHYGLPSPFLSITNLLK